MLNILSLLIAVSQRCTSYLNPPFLKSTFNIGTRGSTRAETEASTTAACLARCCQQGRQSNIDL